MRRRSKAGGEPIKGRRPKTPEPKRRNAPKAAARSNSAVAREETDVARLTRELSEERKQRTAISEVLHLLSGSHGDLIRLFDTILTNATKLCQAKFGALFLCEADAFRIVAQHNAPPAYAELRQREPLTRGRLLLRAAETKQLVQIADIREYVASNRPDKDLAAFAKVSGVRTLLVMPMLKDGEVVGAIVIYRQEVRTFDDREIDLLKSFAAQAVIAIENARLLNELRQLTTDLTESLEQQTATSEVLGVISRSKFKLRPILQSVVDTASQLCRADTSVIFRLEGGVYRFAAGHSLDPAYLDHERQTPISPGPGTVVGRAAMSRTVVQIEDAWTDALYEQKAAVKISGGRSMIGVPLMREGEPIGVIGLARTRVQPFTQREIELVTTFADQAVIAIENVRLFEAEQQRSRELSESLQQQTATSEVLSVISSSPGDLQPVFEAMLEKTVRICDAKFGTLYLREADAFRAVAIHNGPTGYVEARRRGPARPPQDSALGQVANTHLVAQVPDIKAVKSYIDGDPYVVSAVQLGGYRTIAAIPMLKDDELVGAITICRQEVRLFTDKQIELVQNFAAQAVIAIENARLLNELRGRTADLTESLKQQTATRRTQGHQPLDL
jgi:GAF domain-containing protein